MAPSDKPSPKGNNSLPILSDNSAPDISITSDSLGLFPAGYTSSPQASKPNSQHETHDRNLVAHMARFRESPLNFLRELNLHVQGSGWRSYDDIIGQPVFYPGFSENMKQSVLASPMLRARMADLARRRVEVETRMGTLPEKGEKREERMRRVQASLVELADKMTEDMICKMESKPFIRGAYYLVTQLLTRAYHQGGFS